MAELMTEAAASVASVVDTPLLSTGKKGCSLGGRGRFAYYVELINKILLFGVQGSDPRGMLQSCRADFR